MQRLIDLLVCTVRFAVAQQERATAMQSLALTDELTGLHNRRGFLTLARQQLKIAERTGRQLTLLFCDVDGLKQINDRYGHHAGDEILCEAARVLRRTLRDSDIIARLGGDEFAALANEAPDRSRRSMTARLDRAMAIHNRRRPHLPVSMSVGVATYRPGHTRSLEQLMQLADLAMYSAKCAKARVAGASASMVERVGSADSVHSH